MASSRTEPRSRDHYLHRSYVPELDGLRAISVLLVISIHMKDRWAWDWLGGAQGVTIFFVLSGYLITMLALREEAREGFVSLKAFYIRRVCRILPLYYFALFAHFALMLGLGWAAPLRRNFEAALWSYLLYFQEFVFAFQTLGEGKSNPFAHSWTLGIEEKYYLIWPILAFWLWSGRTGPRIIAASALLLLLLPFAGWRHWASADLAPWHLNILIFPYAQILMGCLVALILETERGWRLSRPLGSPLGSAIALAVLIAVHLTSHPLHERWPEHQAIYALAVSAFLVSILLGEGWIQRGLRARGLVALGKLSYGMYLFHGLGTSIAQKLVPPGSSSLTKAILAFAMASACTAAIAWVLAVLIERPCIERGRAWAKRAALRDRSRRRSLAISPSAPAAAGVCPTTPASYG